MVAMDAPRPITPPGWYDDGHGSLRWWDGAQWTQHTAPLTQQVAPQPAQQAPRQAVRTADLVKVPRSKLAWILPIVFVVAALIGGLSAAALWGSGQLDADPLESTYADFVAAERARDCAALQAVTTQSFRDDLWDERFSCEAMMSRPPVLRVGDPEWGVRFGPVGVLIVKERFVGDVSFDDDYAGTTYISYTLVREDGRWKLEDRGDD